MRRMRRKISWLLVGLILIMALVAVIRRPAGETTESRENRSIAFRASEINWVQATVFSNETVVRLKTSEGAQEVFLTPAQNRPDIVIAISSHYAISAAWIDQLMKLKTVSRASSPKDKAIGGDWIDLNIGFQ